MKKIVSSLILFSFALIGLLASSLKLEAQERSIVLTTAKPVGEKISLYIEGEGQVVIDGASGKFEPGVPSEYTLTKQTVTIRGDVTALICAQNQLTDIDASKNVVLTTLDCSQNQLTTPDFSQNTKLTGLFCYSNKIKGPAMERLLNSLPTYQAPEQPLGIEGLYIFNSQNPNEQNVCTKKQVAAIKAKGWIVYDINGDGAARQEYSGSGDEEPTTTGTMTLTTAKAIGEKISLGITAIGEVSVDGIAETFVPTGTGEYTLTKQTITIRGEVTSLNCFSNKLTALDVSHNAALQKLFCWRNQLSTLDVSQNLALKTLHCYNNQLTSLDLSQNANLKILGCWKNELTTLNLSQNPKLVSVDCWKNQLSDLDVSKNFLLEELYCNNNQLKSLDLSQNPRLVEFGCFANQIGDKEMDKLVHSLPHYNSPTKPFGSEGFYVVNTKDPNEQNVCSTVHVAVAKTKGWIVYDFNGEDDEPKEYKGFDTSTQDLVTGSVTIYPNPAKDVVHIEGVRANQPIRLYSLDGRLVCSSRTDASGSVRLDVSALTRATYLLSVGKISRKIAIR